MQLIFNGVNNLSPRGVFIICCEGSSQLQPSNMVDWSVGLPIGNPLSASRVSVKINEADEGEGSQKLRDPSPI